ncbi:hypothetical protein pipiens_020361, partial [Culex pipiens pipiens]
MDQEMNDFMRLLEAELAASEQVQDRATEMDTLIQVVEAELGADPQSQQEEPKPSTSKDPELNMLIQTWETELQSTSETKIKKDDFDEYIQSIERYLEIDEIITNELALVDEAELNALYPLAIASPIRPRSGHYLEPKMLQLRTPEFYKMLWEEDFVTSYDPRFKISMWGFEWLTKGDNSNAVRVDKFITDDEMHRGQSSTIR